MTTPVNRGSCKIPMIHKHSLRDMDRFRGVLEVPEGFWKFIRTIFDSKFHGNDLGKFDKFWITIFIHLSHSLILLKFQQVYFTTYKCGKQCRPR